MLTATGYGTATSPASKGVTFSSNQIVDNYMGQIIYPYSVAAHYSCSATTGRKCMTIRYPRDRFQPYLN